MRHAIARPLMVAILAMLGSLHVSGQDTRREVTTSALDAQGVLIAAFPELHDTRARLTWRTEPTPTGFVVEAREAVAPFLHATPAPALVRAVVALDEDGRLTSLHAGGTLIARAQQRAREATAGRESDRAIADALREAGARFVPDGVTDVRALVPAGLYQRLGAPEIRATTFRARAVDEGPGAALTWRVELDRQDAGGVLQSYTVVVEPVEGRLLSLVRR